MNLKNLYQVIKCDETIGEMSLGEVFSLSERTLLFFYPKNDTPGCTVENIDFTSMKKQFEDIGVTLVGVSKDSLESHKKFRDKYDLQVGQISDPDLMLHKELGAFGEKNNYGKIVQGVIRSTFLFDSNGNILQEWRNVKAKGHAEKVLREIEK